MKNFVRKEFKLFTLLDIHHILFKLVLRIFFVSKYFYPEIEKHGGKIS